jgi:hypothetical protein
MRSPSHVLTLLIGPLLAMEAFGPHCLVVLSPIRTRLIMTPELGDTMGEQVYSEFDTVSADVERSKGVEETTPSGEQRRTERAQWRGA